MSKKILLSNKFYYPRGGVENVTIATRKLLLSKGYDVAVFTMDYNLNISEKDVFSAPEVRFDGGIKNLLSFAGRTFGGSGLKKAFTEALDSFAPDVLHLHNIHSYLSPAMAKIAHDRDIRVVWTLHDYKLICPAYDCLNHGETCERCFTRKSSVLTSKCFKNSMAASALAYAESLKWNRNWIERHVDMLICPSEFMRRQMLKAGFSDTKLTTICNFVDPQKASSITGEANHKRENYYAYIGRLSHEKGLDTLLNAASQLPFMIKIAGDGPLRDRLERKYRSCNHIKFVGKLDATGVADLLGNAKASVVPSEWYENNPLSVIESLCAGTPVIGAAIGGIPELINDSCGLTFTAGNAGKLQAAITDVMSDRLEFDNAAIAADATNRFSSGRHLSELEKVYFPT